MKEDRLTIYIPTSWEDEIKTGGIPPILGGDYNFQSIKGWIIQLRFSGKGWIRLYLCGGDQDHGGWEIEDWALSFRISDINKETWKTIKFEDEDVLIQLAWDEK
jgi:hypothetical protein